VCPSYIWDTGFLKVKESLITMDWRVYAICLEDVAPNVTSNMLSTVSRTADKSLRSILGIVWGANNFSP
jgi:hypothetical protein